MTTAQPTPINRKRIAERPRANGSGAFGRLEVTGDVSAYTTRWGQRAEDFRDQGGVRGATPGAPPEQLGRRMQGEGEQRTVALGQVKRVLERAS